MLIWPQVGLLNFGYICRYQTSDSSSVLVFVSSVDFGIP